MCGFRPVEDLKKGVQRVPDAFKSSQKAAWQAAE
jgi:hypothetical protein